MHHLTLTQATRAFCRAWRPHGERYDEMYRMIEMHPGAEFVPADDRPYEHYYGMMHEIAAKTGFKQSEIEAELHFQDDLSNHYCYGAPKPER